MIKGKLGEIQKCYDQQLQEGKSSDFTLKKNELESAQVYRCATDAIERWNFPKGKPTYIRHTFHLKEAQRKTAYIVEGAESVTVEK